MSDNLFLHCIGLWHKLYILARMVWVQPGSYCHMMTILIWVMGILLEARSFEIGLHFYLDCAVREQ